MSKKVTLSFVLVHNVFALYVVWVLKLCPAEMVLTMIQCLIDICKAEINNLPEGTIFANALYFRPNYIKRVLVAGFLFNNYFSICQCQVSLVGNTQYVNTIIKFEFIFGVKSFID